MKKVTFVYRQRWLFSMISVPSGTGDISSIWYRTIVRWYTLRVCRKGYYIIFAAQLYHTASRISYRVSDISLKNTAFYASSEKGMEIEWDSGTEALLLTLPASRGIILSEDFPLKIVSDLCSWGLTCRRSSFLYSTQSLGVRKVVSMLILPYQWMWGYFWFFR